MSPLRIYAGAAAYCLHYRWTLLKYLIVPLALLWTWTGLSLYQESTDTEYVSGMLGWLTRLFLLLAFTTWFAVVVHRVIVLGPDKIGASPRRWLQILGWFAFKMVLVMLIVIPFSFLAMVPALGGILAALAMLYVLCRLSLVFPGIATGRNVTFGLSWKLTADIHLPLFLILGLIPAAGSVMVDLLTPHSLWVIGSMFDMLITLLSVAALSLIYREIKESIFASEGQGTS